MATVRTFGAITAGAAAVAPEIQRRSSGSAMPVANTTSRTLKGANHQVHRRWLNEVIGIRVLISNLHHAIS
jgi:hypothetical protein